MNYVSDKGLVFKMYNERLQPNNKAIVTQFKNRQRI